MLPGRYRVKRQIFRDIPDEHMKLTPSNRQDRRINGSSGAIVYCGFLGVLVISSNESTTCTKINELPNVNNPNK